MRAPRSDKGVRDDGVGGETQLGSLPQESRHGEAKRKNIRNRVYVFPDSTPANPEDPSVVAFKHRLECLPVSLQEREGWVQAFRSVAGIPYPYYLLVSSGACTPTRQASASSSSIHSPATRHALTLSLSLRSAGSLFTSRPTAGPTPSSLQALTVLFARQRRQAEWMDVHGQRLAAQYTAPRLDTFRANAPPTTHQLTNSATLATQLKINSSPLISPACSPLSLVLVVSFLPSCPVSPLATNLSRNRGSKPTQARAPSLPWCAARAVSHAALLFELGSANNMPSTPAAQRIVSQRTRCTQALHIPPSSSLRVPSHLNTRPALPATHVLRRSPPQDPSSAVRPRASRDSPRADPEKRSALCPTPPARPCFGSTHSTQGHLRPPQARTYDCAPATFIHSSPSKFLAPLAYSPPSPP
ncbi:hypothetical protein B0H14DRAFT_2592178 [Mycena olivaceomarginata]|nr:hypothetical protein B0H14DRAFT_2592178 [Mycena olivaceomarginata]